MLSLAGKKQSLVPGARPYLDALRRQVAEEMERARLGGAGGIGQRGPLLEHFLSLAERYVRARRGDPRRSP